MRPSGRKNKFHPADLRGRPAEDQQGAWAPRSAGPPPPKVLSQLSHMQTVPRKHLGAAVTLSKHTSAATDFRLPESLILIPRVHIKNITAAVSGTLLTDEMRQAAGQTWATGGTQQWGPGPETPDNTLSVVREAVPHPEDKGQEGQSQARPNPATGACAEGAASFAHGRSFTVTPCLCLGAHGNALPSGCAHAARCHSKWPRRPAAQDRLWNAPSQPECKADTPTSGASPFVCGLFTSGPPRGIVCL